MKLNKLKLWSLLPLLSSPMVFAANPPQCIAPTELQAAAQHNQIFNVDELTAPFDMCIHQGGDRVTCCKAVWSQHLNTWYSVGLGYYNHDVNLMLKTDPKEWQAAEGKASASGYFCSYAHSSEFVDLQYVTNTDACNDRSLQERLAR